MKKIVLAVIIYFAFFNLTFAQNDEELELSFGGKAGLNYSNIYDEEGEDFIADGKVGIVVGVFAFIPIGPFLGIQPEVLFSQKGYNAQGSLLGSSYDITRTTNFLDIPILVGFKPVENVTLLAGPQFSYLLSQNIKYESGKTTFEQAEQFENDNIRRNTLGFLIGLDVTIKQFIVGGRAGWDLQKNDGDGNSLTPRYKNQWLQLTFGIVF